MQWIPGSGLGKTRNSLNHSKMRFFSWLPKRSKMVEQRLKIHAIPELDGTVEGVELSHKAAVGKIA